jgi:hypothetical protein
LATDILIFVEDPGAANYVARLPAALIGNGWKVKLFADGYAKHFLLQQGINFEAVDDSLQASELLLSERPRLLIVGTSENLDTLGLKLSMEARSMGIKSVGVVDALGNAAYRFRGHSDGPLLYAPDYLAVPDRWTQEAYIALGYSSENVAVCGHPHYDHILDSASRMAEEDRKVIRKKLFPDADETLPLVVFAAEISAGIRPRQYYERSDEYTLNGRGNNVGRTEIVMEEFLDAISAMNCPAYLVLRMHPKNTEEELSSFIDEFDYVSRAEPSDKLIYAADLVVGMSTILLFEAAIMGTPTLSVLPRTIEKESVIGVLSGITHCVTTRDELRLMLPELLSSESYKRQPDNKNIIVKNSTERVVKFIEEFLTLNT